jgi:selenocysteine-specific elongation factor
MRRLVLGTAGHIDHGKTALVRALTGVDTDRLPEEKRRGITIDLGFANLRVHEDVEFGIVDVPGHEAFVRNMLAGATGIDLVLLVVAADAGVMPQTREHAAIVELLGVTRGVVAITKVDLVDDEWLELVRGEVHELLADGGLAGAPIVAVSARTGAGLDELKRALEVTAGSTPARESHDLFRMPIDRVFTVRGTGTVVTGTVWSGALRRDAQVRVEPAGFMARVRGLQRHGVECDQVRAGERAAIALAGVSRAALTRGDTLLQGAAWAGSSILTVRLSALADAGAPLRARQRVRISLGTAEVLARLALPEGELQPGKDGLAQLRLERPVVARARDRFVIRSYSPVRTIAGGTVLEPHAPRRKRFTELTAQALHSLTAAVDGAAAGGREVAAAEAGGADAGAADTGAADAAATDAGAAAEAARLLAAAVALAGSDGVPVERLPVLTGVSPRLLDAAMIRLTHELVTIGDVVLPARQVEACRQQILDRLRAHHAAQPLEDGMDKEALRRASGDPGSRPAGAVVAFDAALQRLLENGLAEARGSAIALPGYLPAPDPAQRVVLDRLARFYAAAGLQAPDLSELPHDLAGSDTPALLRFLERQRVLVRLGPTRWADAAAVALGVSQLQVQLPAGQQLTIADFKQVVNLSRKHLIPLLEYLDRAGVTVRSGDVRLLVTGSDVPASVAVAAEQPQDPL